jgi:carnosine N-methyltransferase
VRGEGSVELSLDEVKDLARKVGFELSVSFVIPFCPNQGELGEAREADEQEEKLIKSSYTGIPDSMLRHEYQVSPVVLPGQVDADERPHFG